ncbi:hypothetical protein [Actinoplanes sp. NPDC026670]|uniref:hypothetical protein n=1 Tax=Actinoplanes sp. NPDC026670 TaxID=3154700 RepID=UPI0033EB1263
MRNMIQLLGGVAVAGVVAAGSTAFTAGAGLGLTETSTATSSRFIGGSVTQTVSGARINGITYAYANAPSNTQVTGVTITFNDAAANGKTITVVPGGGAYGAATADEFYCPAIGSATVTCITALNSDNTHAAASYYAGLTSLAITVS